MQKNKTVFFAVPFIIILIGLLIYQYGYLSVQSDLTSIREEEAVKTEKLQRYLSLISERPGLEQRIVSLRKEREADNSKLIEGQTASLAAATLQRVIKEIVTGSGGTLSSERVEKPQDIEKLQVISISIDGLLPNANALKDVLYSIETRTPYLVVKELDVRVRNYRKPADELMVKLTVSAVTGGK